MFTNQIFIKRSNIDRRVDNRTRSLFNVMPLGYCRRKNKIERRSPLDRRTAWVSNDIMESEIFDNRIMGES